MEARKMVTFDPSENEAMDCQFTLSQLVVPRPIAMVSTESPDGIPNIAPMSYFMPITGSPMLVGVTMGLREDGGQKHSYENAIASGDFVINVTSDVFAAQIEDVAMESPSDVDEFALVGWTPVPATKISSPAIGEALARLECKVSQVVELGEAGVPFGEVHLIIGEVVWVEYDEAILNEKGRIDPLLLAPVSRLGLRSFLRTVPEGIYNLPRVPWDEYAAESAADSKSDS